MPRLPIDSPAMESYRFAGWTMSQPAPDTILFRPGAGAFARVLLWSTLALLMIACVRYGAATLRSAPLFNPTAPARESAAQRERETIEQDLREILSKEQYADYLSRMESAATDAAARAQRVRDGITAAEVLLMALLALVALWMPARCLWQRVRIEVDAARNLSVTRRRIFLRTRSWPLYLLSRIEIARQLEWDASCSWRVGVFDLARQRSLSFEPSRRARVASSEQVPQGVEMLSKILSRITGMPREVKQAVYVPKSLRRWPICEPLPMLCVPFPYHSIDELPPDVRVIYERSRQID